METRLPFTVEEGIAIQTENLKCLEKVLNAYAYNRLSEKIERENKKLTADSSGYDVFRGQALTNFIDNLSRDIILE